MAAESGIGGWGEAGWRTRFGRSTRAWRNIRGLLKRKTNGRKPFSLDTLELSENKGLFPRWWWRLKQYTGLGGRRGQEIGDEVSRLWQQSWMGGRLQKRRQTSAGKTVLFDVPRGDVRRFSLLFGERRSSLKP